MNRAYRDLGLASILLASSIAYGCRAKQQPAAPSAQAPANQAPIAPGSYFLHTNGSCSFTEFGRYVGIERTFETYTPVITVADLDKDGDADVLLTFSDRYEDHNIVVVLCENRISDAKISALPTQAPVRR